MFEFSAHILISLVIIIAAVFYFHTLTRSPKKYSKNSAGATPFLNQYTTDFTALARSGTIDTVVGRTDEVRKLTQVLSRRRKNNALLVGAPGVGKTALVEGLAQRIVSEEVPPILHGKRVLTLDVATLLSGTKYRGEFEERAKKIIQEITSSGRSIILFIDEIHAVIQSHGAEGAINFSDILKPALARGDLQLIGATTHEEYEKYIKTDLSLERRFQPIEVQEPTVAEALQIIQGVKDKYREYHKVEFTDAALMAAVTMTQKLIYDRKLPDKALDAIDEAGAMVHISHLHPAIAPLLYQAAAQAHPRVVALWTKLQTLDTKIAANPKQKNLIRDREKIEEQLQENGLMTVDTADIEKVIREWLD